jgi:hypothetical protein
LTPEDGRGPQRIEWQVVVGDREESEAEPEIIWRSNEFTHLTVNTQGIAIGSAQVSVRKLLEALVKVLPDTTIEGILRILTREWFLENREAAYRYFYLRILVGDRFVRFPIDMGVSGYP